MRSAAWSAAEERFAPLRAMQPQALALLDRMIAVGQVPEGLLP